MLLTPKKHAVYPPQGYIAISTQHLEHGLRFPIPPYLIEFLNTVKLVPFQLAPNSYAQLTSLALAFLKNGLRPPTPKIIQTFYSIKGLSAKPGENQTISITSQAAI